MKDIISVIMCAYNAEDTIEKAIKSVLMNRTYEEKNPMEVLFDIQLIIINDGSTDRTEEIIERYGKTDSRIFSYTWDNHGLSCSREKSLEFVKGQYIAFCDSDDWVEPDWLISMYSIAKQYDADLVRFRALIDGHTCVFNPQEILVWDSKQAIREFFIHKKSMLCCKWN